MQGKKNQTQYEGFPYTPGQLHKFLVTAGIFTISLKGSTTVIHYTPDDAPAFKAWLIGNGVKDMRAERKG